MHGGNVYQVSSVSFSPSPNAAVGAVVGTTTTTTTTTSAIATAAALTTTTSSSSSTRTAPAAATRTTFSTVAAISATSTSKTAQPHDPLHSQRRLIKTMVSGWVASMDKRPGDRTGEDLDLIYCRLKEIQAFDKFHPMLLHQICIVGYYEDLEKGVTLFRQGDIGTNWYTVVSGTLQVYLSDTGDQKDLVTLCTLGTGTTFGESVLTSKPRHATVVTSDFCELIRVEQKDFKILWERNKQLMEGVITPLSSLRADKSDILKSHQRYTRDASVLSQKFNGLPPPNCVAPITDDPSEAMFHAKDILRTVIMIQAPHMIRDRKYHLRTYRQCMVGTEMVDWLMQYSTLVLTRIQAVGMWQALLEEGVISHVCEEHPFRDKYLFYRFVDGRTDTVGTGIASTGGTSGHGLPPPPQTMELKHYEEELADVLKMLSQVGPDAIMRMILRKPSCERSPEDLEIIYEELLHIKALSHLSTMVKRELAGVLMFESHTKKGTVLFRQGDEGKSWYIILKGSVNVSIYGKGIVCKLMEGDDFGKLALVNDAPRSATICLCEDNCHFLRVDKEDFNRILRDVEANTVRLNEHGQDVLVLEKMPTNVQAQDGSIQSHYKYSVMAGTPEKILEHLLETRMEKNESDDHFLESFLLTHVIFIPTKKLCPALMMHYEAISGSKDESQDIILSHKRRVIQFVQEWQSISGDEFLEDNTISAFLKELQHTLSNDSVAYPELKNDVTVIEHMMQARLSNNTMEPPKYSMKKRLTPNVILARKGSKENVIDESKFRRGSIKAADESIFRVYCADHSYCTLRVPMTTTVSQIINQAQEKLALGEDLVLCEVKSNGERILFRENDLGVINSLTLNGRLFLAPREHLDAVTPLPEQDEILTGTASSLELVGSQELAYHMTVYDWELFTAVPEYELIYQVFGRYKFGKTTANLDLFLRRFNEVQYWVVTEMLLTQNLSKRVHLLRKFIKLASYCREYQNMSSFFAIVLGLSNIAVSRLSQTWEKLPGKLKKMFSEFETIMDPSRNHRVYRLSIAKMRPPIIPFMPLLMKDMTFTHEGNKTYYDGLVNFEKMHMIAQTLRTVRCCRSVPLNLDLPNSSVKPPFDVKAYVRNLVVMDNQRTLAQLSHKLEPRRT